MKTVKGGKADISVLENLSKQDAYKNLLYKLNNDRLTKFRSWNTAKQYCYFVYDDGFHNVTKDCIFYIIEM